MSKTRKGDSSEYQPHPEAKGLVILLLSLAALLSLLSFKYTFPKGNWLGLIGYWLGLSMHFILGYGSYLACGFGIWAGWKLISIKNVPKLGIKALYFSLFTVSLCMLLNLFAEHQIPLFDFIKNKTYSETIILHHPFPHKFTRVNLGGVPLYYLYRDLPLINLQHLLSDIGITLTFSITLVLSFLLFSEIHLLAVLNSLVSGVSQSGSWIVKALSKLTEMLSDEEPSETLARPAIPKEPKISLKTSPDFPQPSYNPEEKEKTFTVRSLENLKLKISAHKSSAEKTQAAREETPKMSKKELAVQAQRVFNGDFTAYQLPPLSLLTSPKKIDQPSLEKDLRKQAEILEETLMSFGIEAKVGEIHCGPTITSFEVHPSVGVKVQKIKALENDIALNLQAKSIRIIAPIPGKAAVGVEIPSLYPQEVSFKEMCGSYQHNPRKFMIPVLLGKTVSGEEVMSDLAKMPHCIIAGATGSGKSVCINTVVMSILMNARPDEIKLMMIDPKKVELTPYTSLPHMIAPVITEAHGAYAALTWLVKEMEKRYEILKQLGVRNISAFNSRKVNKELEDSLEIDVPEKMFGIVAIIDEFADLMMVSDFDLETPIARIAQMARAVGIHLILATQRPSREVITGLIKANFPTRVSFKVASRINSQIILDEPGAESLLGNGDMLFLPPGSSHLMRAQGAYIRDEDINRVVSFICDQAPCTYLIESFDDIKREDLSLDSDEGPRDSLFDQAKTLVIEAQNASTTFLQRKLKIGYARAASLMDELEERGVIGPQEGSKPRKIYQKSSMSTNTEDLAAEFADFEEENS